MPLWRVHCFTHLKTDLLLSSSELGSFWPGGPSYRGLCYVTHWQLYLYSPRWGGEAETCFYTLLINLVTTDRQVTLSPNFFTFLPPPSTHTHPCSPPNASLGRLVSPKRAICHSSLSISVKRCSQWAEILKLMYAEDSANKVVVDRKTRGCAFQSIRYTLINNAVHSDAN